MQQKNAMRSGGALPLPKHQGRGQVAPYITSDPKEYAKLQKAYNDSLNLYNRYIKDLRLRGSSNLERSLRINDPLISDLLPLYGVHRNDPIQPIRVDEYRGGYSGSGTAFIPVYKKPVRKVVLSSNQNLGTIQQRTTSSKPKKQLVKEMRLPMRGMPQLDIDIEEPTLRRPEHPQGSIFSKEFYPGRTFYYQRDSKGNVRPIEESTYGQLKQQGVLEYEEGGLAKAQAGTAYVESLCGPGYIESVDESGNKVCVDPSTQPQRPDIGYQLRQQYKDEPTKVYAGYNGPYDGIAEFYSNISTPLESNYSGYCPECEENQQRRRGFNLPSFDFPSIDFGDMFSGMFQGRPKYSGMPGFRKRKCKGIDCFKFQDGGDSIPAVNTAVASPIIEPLAPKQDLPPYVDQRIIDQPFVKIVDTRKVHPVSGNPIRPNKDLKTGKYQKKVIDTLIKEAKKYDLSKEDVLNNLAISLQETGLGNLTPEIGHALHGDYISGTIGDKDYQIVPALSDEEVTMYEEDPYLKGARLQLMNYKYNTSVLNKPTKNLERMIQYYNTPYPEKGQLRSTTELDKYGKPNKMWYGTDVTKQPLSTSGNPYGKTISSLRPLIEDNPMIQYMLYKQGYKKTGGLTADKAREILHDKSVHGHPLTEKQRRFFGAIASGNKIRVKLKK